MFSEGPVDPANVKNYLTQRYSGGETIYDYFTVDDMRKIMRKFPTEGEKPEAAEFVKALLAQENISADCKPEVVINLFVLDMGVFMFWKKVRLPGTEDMDEEYRQNVIPSLKGGLYGIFIGIPVCLLCGALIILL